MKKRIIIFGGIFLVGFLLASLLSGIRQDGPVPEPVPIFNPPVLPDLPIKNLEYTLPSPKAFPTSLQRYTYSNPPANEINSKIARSLGFTSQPTTYQDIAGDIQVWVDGNNSLSLQGSPPSLAYTTNVTGISTLPQNFLAEAEPRIKDFAENILDIRSLGYIVEIEEVLYFTIDDDEPAYVEDPQAAFFAEIFLIYTLPEGPVYPDSAAYWGKIWINSRLEIVRAHLLFPPTVQKAQGAISTLSYEDAVMRLNNNQGLLVSYAAENPTVKGFEEIALRVSVIESADLGYYYTRNNAEFMPIYRFKGKAESTNSTKPISTYTIVSALP